MRICGIFFRLQGVRKMLEVRGINSRDVGIRSFCEAP